MCARYTLRASGEELASLFGVETSGPWAPAYNIAPSSAIPVVRVREGSRAWDRLQWGLVPAWADDPGIGARLINARAETAHEKPAFRGAFRRRRCLIPADGFFEWTGPARSRQPFFFERTDAAPFAFAGLWDVWERPEGYLETCTILTTSANEEVAPVHDRMPVILEPSDWEAWLDPDEHRTEILRPLLRPYAAGALRAYRVSPRMNDVRFQGPECVQPIEGPSLF